MSQSPTRRIKVELSVQAEIVTDVALGLSNRELAAAVREQAEQVIRDEFDEDGTAQITATAKVTSVEGGTDND